MPRHTSLVRIEWKNLLEREGAIKTMTAPILAEKWLSGKRKSSTNSLRIDLSTSAGSRLRTTLENFRAEYFEIWVRAGEESGENELWSLDKAYFTLFKLNDLTESYDEFLALHCEAGFLPVRTEGIANGEYDGKHEKHRKQECYQRMIHLHISFLSQYAIEKHCPSHSHLSVNNCLAKSHIGLALGRTTFEFDSLDSMTETMKQAIKMVKDEILGELAEYEQ